MSADLDERVERQNFHVPCLPDFWFTRAPTAPLSVSIGLGLQQLGESMVPGNQEPMSAESCPCPATECIPEESPALSNLDERPFPARTRGLPQGGFSRAMGLFMQPSAILSEADMIQDCIQEDDSNIQTAPSPRSHFPSFDSSPGSSLSFTGYSSQRLRNSPSSQADARPVTPDIPDAEASTLSHPHQPHVASAFGNSDGAGSRGRSRRASGNWTNSSSPSLPSVSELAHRRQLNIFGSLFNFPIFSLTLAAGKAAQKRRFD
ncbi:uncharacterized protein N7484_003006 [Penicillium longicatenatum]|uniref:uncharacterized protein n=1 Tax=Penicillium longicatenatum TaxID=1561947 RepID=UPI00254741AB|nr:uncharacterized protein N7484_003006 [Penicillium longicatenatum]KAJ5649283.1 hypothetical protein N7484_003006 [Penicillium longicatenatum]